MRSFKRSDYNVLVSLFLREPKKINYAQQYAIAKKLLVSYGDFTFWKGHLLECKRGVLNSLAYFLTEDGKLFLKNSYFYHKKRETLDIFSPEQEDVPLSNEIVGENLKKKATKKISLIDFIKNDS